jgi:peptidylprolyl isomerase
MSTELEIIDLKVGEGKEAVRGALITTHYTGWLEDGTKFDSSIDRGNYFETVIGTGRVIKGWDQGIMGMRVGGNVNWLYQHIWLMVRKMGKIIPANANLTFEIEFLMSKHVMNNLSIYIISDLIDFID